MHYLWLQISFKSLWCLFVSFVVFSGCITEWPIFSVAQKFPSSVSIHPPIRLVPKMGEPCGLACALLMSQMRKLVSHPNPHKHYVKAHISCTTTTMNSILLSLMVTLETETDLSCTQGELFLCISMESFYDPAFLPTKMARLIIHVESTTLLNWDTANQLERWVTEVSRRQHPKKGWCVVWVWGSRVLGLRLGLGISGGRRLPWASSQTSLTGHLGKASESSCRELLLTLTFQGKFFSGIGYCNSFKSWANLCFGSHDRKVTSISKAVRKTWGIQGLPECKCKTSVLWGCLHCSCCLVQVCLWNCGRFQVLDCVVEGWGSNPHLRWLPSCLGKNRVSSSKLSSVAPLLLHSAPSVLST